MSRRLIPGRTGGRSRVGVLGLVLAFLLPSWWFATVTSSAVPSPPTVTITPVDAAVVVGEPLEVRVAVSNPGPEPISVNVHPTGGFQGLAFSIAANGGAFRPYAPPSVRAIGLADLELSPVPLAPGETIEKTVVLAFNLLTQDFPFPAAGSYQLQATLFQQPGDPTTGVASNVVGIQVAAPSGAAADALSFIRSNGLGPLMTPDAVYELEARFTVGVLQSFVGQFPATPYARFVQMGLDATCASFPSFCGGAVATGSVSGRVVNAVSGQPIAGASVQVRAPAASGEPPCSNPTLQATASTDGSGNYTIPDVSAGSHDVQIGASGFITTCQDGVTVVADQVAVVNVSLSPSLTEGQLRFVLTWGAQPRDLDSHVWTPATVPYHVAYFRTGALESCPFASLDRDVTGGFGPETITIGQLLTGRYVYAIHNFSGSPPLAGSGAQVQVFSNDGLLTTIRVPATGTGGWWHVLNLDSSTGIEEINQLGNSPAPYADTDAGCRTIGFQREAASSTVSPAAPTAESEVLPPKS